MKNYTDKLLDMAARGQKETSKYRKLCAEFGEVREAKKESFFSRTKEMLKKILPEAEKRGIILGIENRQSLEELPADPDFEFLFRDIDNPHLAYWHDTGHAQIK